MGTLDPYLEFLAGKVPAASAAGIAIEPGAVNPMLKGHQRAIVEWAVRGGRRAVFAAFGLGKSVIQIEALRLILAAVGGRGLIVAPLGVRQEFMRDAAMLGVPLRFIRRIEEADADGIYITNYETVRDGKLDPAHFTAASLDEASCLRGFGGTKTFREFMRLFEVVRFRFVATATPSPNEFIELLAYAAFLGVMDVGQAKTRFFKRNSEQADKLTIHPHKIKEFWLWVASWAVLAEKPSDLGFSDEGYVLPPLDVRWHEIPTNHAGAEPERDGQGRMFKDSAIGVSAAAREKRASLDARVAKLMEIVNDGRGAASGVSARVLQEEQGAAACAAAREGQEELSSEAAGLCAPAAEDATAEVRPDPKRISGHARRSGRRVRDLHDELPGAADGGRPLSQDGPGAGHPVRAVQHRDRSARGLSGADHGGGGLPDQIIIWCDLNDEQRGIERALAEAGISFSSLYGNQDIDTREALLQNWRARETTVLLTKPSMYGAGVNLQQSHRMIFAGIGFKFADIIQGVHRICRFLQTKPCQVDFIYTEAEREIRRTLEAKWQRHRELTAELSRIIGEYGLSVEAMASALKRSIGVRRQEAEGRDWRMVNADSVEETRGMEAGSVDLIVTSIPFGAQYEYSPSYNDFGHTDDNAHFWRQMDFLTPELLRVLRPGRIAAIHVKDRIVPGGINGLGFQTVEPFSDECAAHFRRHGFAFLSRKTIPTDVVRENNQTYRLGWSEQCKDGSRMGNGMPEYLLIFRKPPSDLSNGYGDVPVVKEKPLCDDHGEPAPFDKRTNWKRPVPGTGYSRARWQLDAHGYARSSGDRLITSDELRSLPHEALYKLWRDRGAGQVYDFAEHLAVCEEMDHAERLPSTFMLFPPHSNHPDVWTDIARMRTLNMVQSSKGKEQHLCPLPFDIVDRAIVQYSMPGELVLDPFAGLGTVPYCALKLGRRGLGFELSADYYAGALYHLRAAERGLATVTLFDLIAAEAAPGETPAEAAE